MTLNLEEKIDLSNYRIEKARRFIEALEKVRTGIINGTV